ncbi:hypothetical protein QBC41DRAFT_38882 [Cercophora samala]|uniref:Uncharacterized protein n=1 Tax=Cercophora samala TaxID=330535 RepID=A0AA39ZJ76_9PEZI|nr:hypothetical protein QBC41DRAFT_38882 [Cercophora samala]
MNRLREAGPRGIRISRDVCTESQQDEMMPFISRRLHLLCIDLPHETLKRLLSAAANAQYPPSWFQRSSGVRRIVATRFPGHGHVDRCRLTGSGPYYEGIVADFINAASPGSKYRSGRALLGAAGDPMTEWCGIPWRDIVWIPVSKKLSSEVIHVQASIMSASRRSKWRNCCLLRFRVWSNGDERGYRATALLKCGDRPCYLINGGGWGSVRW